MTAVDWLIVGAVTLSVVLAAAQGFFFELFSLAGVVIGYLAAAYAYPRAASWYMPFVKSSWMAEAAGFLTIFIGVVLLAGIVGRIARWGFKEAGLGWADRLLGAAFGLARGTLLVTVLLLAVTSFAPNSRLLAGSRIAPYLLVLGRGAAVAAPAQLQARFRQGATAVRELRAQGGAVSEQQGPAKPAPAETKGK
ncbi:MAG: CvpA family protein [Terriglobales bacterium]